MLVPANFTKRKTRYRRLKVMLGAALVGLLVVFLALRNIGSWLVVEDPLEKAGAIAVLSGGLPIRALGAADLYREGWAPKILLTRSTQTEEALARLNVTYYGEQVNDQEVLIHEGVPAQAITVLPTPIVNTADELREIAATLPSNGAGVVIVITSKEHTRRVRALWRRFGRGRAIVRAASEDPFEPRRWWRTSGDALDVVRECLGLLNTWAGFPLRGS